MRSTWTTLSSEEKGSFLAGLIVLAFISFFVLLKLSFWGFLLYMAWRLVEWLVSQ